MRSYGLYQGILVGMSLLADDPTVSPVWDNTAADTYSAWIAAAGHIDFGDYLFMLETLPDIDPALFGGGTLAADLMHEINRDLNLAFFEPTCSVKRWAPSKLQQKRMMR